MTIKQKETKAIKPTRNTLVHHHPLKGGGFVQVYRDGLHHYWREGDEEGTKVPSVSSLVNQTDGSLFGAASGYTISVIRDNNGDLEAPRRINKEALEAGNQFHETVEDFIKNGKVDEESGMFLAWYHAEHQGQKMGDKSWVAAESLIHCPPGEFGRPGFGGTLDALAVGLSGEMELWDWKTKSESYIRNGGYLHEQAQLGGYAEALRIMGSVYQPTVGYIAYVVRTDEPQVYIQTVDLEFAKRLFRGSWANTLLKEEAEARGYIHKRS